MGSLFDDPMVRLAIGLGIVVVVAGLSLFSSIKDNLIAGAQNSATLIPVIVVAWAWNGFRNR